MPDPLSPTVALGTALNVMKTVREHSKDSNDLVLKEKVGELFDALLDLKSSVSSLQDVNAELQTENSQLRQRLEQKASVRREKQFGYLFKEGEDSPLCPTCYDDSNGVKLIYLSPIIHYFGGEKRICRVCDHTYWEKPMKQTTVRVATPWS